MLSIATAPIAALLLAINHFNKPVMFAKMPILVFGSLTAYVICFTMAVSDLPDQLFPDQDSPISTREDMNGTEWVLNIGGVFENNNPQGLQIPMYIIIAGILGAYIRYLYLGIPEFKTAIHTKLARFKESERSMYYAAVEYLTQFNEELQEGNKYESNKGSEPAIEAAREKLAKLSFEKSSIIARFFGQGALSITDIPPPKNRRKKRTNSFTNQSTESTPEQRESSSQKGADQHKKQSVTTKDSWDEWEEVLNRISDFEKDRFALAFEATSYILKTVGSFHLAPLLSVLAWLLLSVGGANDYRTFALVSFAIGLTTKTIIKRVMSFVGEQFKEDEDQDTSKRTEPSSISTDPAQAKTGQILAVTGKGFSADSVVSLYYGDNGVDKSIVNSLPTSTSGTFVYEFPLRNISPKIYTLKAKDNDGNSASTTLVITE